MRSNIFYYAKSIASKQLASAKAPTSISRSVSRKLSASFKFTVRPKLVSLKKLKQLLACRSHLLPFLHSPPHRQQLNKKFSILEVTVASPSPPAPGVIPKRKRVTGEMKYYAVRKGCTPGIYTTWKECLAQVTGFKGATCKCKIILSPTNTIREGSQ